MKGLFKLIEKIKIFDIRNLKTEYQILRGHKKEASAVSWHPVHEGLITTGGSEGSIIFWLVGEETVKYAFYKYFYSEIFLGFDSNFFF